jgi:hypothetical protein
MLFLLFAFGLVLSLIGIALYRGEQYPEIGEFNLIFYLSIFGTVVFTLLLVIGIMYFRPKSTKD